MAVRFNKKVVIILIVCVVVVLGAGGGLIAAKIYRDSVDRRMRLGQEAADVGEWREAMRQYGLALNKERNDVAILDKYLEALNKAEVKDRVESGNRIQSLVSATKKRSDLRTSDADSFAAVMEIYEVLGGWDPIAFESETKLKSHPDMLVARRYRGIASARRMVQKLDMTEAERTQAIEDLQAAIAANPDDVDASYFLALANWEMALFYDVEGRDRTLAVEPRAEAIKIGDKIYSDHSDNAEAVERYVSLQLAMENKDKALAGLDRLEELVTANIETIERQLEKANKDEALAGLDISEKLAAANIEMIETQLVVRAADLLYRTDMEVVVGDDGKKVLRGLTRALALLDAAIGVKPDNIRLRYNLGAYLSNAGRKEEALETFRDGREFDGKKLPIEAAEAYHYTDLCRTGYANLLVERGIAEQGADREKTMAEVKEELEFIKENTVGLDAWINLIEAKRLAAANEFEASATHFDRAIATFETNRVAGDLLMNAEYVNAVGSSAKLHRQLQNLGTAIERYKKLLDYGPMLRRRAQLALGEIWVQTKNFQQARGMLAMLKATPDDVSGDLQGDRFRIAMIEISLNREDKKIPEAIRLCNALIEESIGAGRKEQEIAAKLTLAEIYANNGRKDEAKKITRALYDETPDRYQLLRAAFMTEDDDDAALAMIDGARQRGDFNEAALQALASMRADEEEKGKIQEQIIADAEKDPFNREVKLYVLSKQRGDHEAARKHLAEAQKLKADDPFILEATFEYAIADGDFAKARQIAAKARSINADRAEGMLFQAQLETALGQHQRAVISYAQALDIRPNFAQAWRMKGDAQQKAGDFNGARESYDRCLQIQPRNTRAMVGLATVHREFNEVDQMLAQLTKAREFANGELAIELEYIKMIQAFGDDKDEALRLRRRLAERAPKQFDNRRYLILLLAERQRESEAERELAKLIEEDGVNMTNMNVKARMLVLLDRADEGVEVLTNYLQELGDDAKMIDWLTAARFLNALNQKDASLLAYKKARMLEDPEARPATRELANLLRADGRLDQAAMLAQGVWDQDHDDAALGWMLADLYVQLRQPDDCEKVLKEMPSSEQEAARMVAFHGRVEKLRGNIDQARRLFTEAIKMEPANARYHFDRATVHLKDEYAPIPRAAVREMESDLSKAIELKPSYIEARVQMAMVQEAVGRIDEAIRQWDAVLNFKPRAIGERERYAQLLARHGRWATLETMLDAAMKEFKNKQHRWPAIKAGAMRSQGKLSEALSLYEQAFALRKDPAYLIQIGDLLVRTGDPRRAVAIISANAEISERSAMLQAIQGHALAKLGRDEPADSCFVRAVALAGNLSLLQAVRDQMIGAWGLERAAARFIPLTEERRDPWVVIGAANTELALGNYQPARDRLLAVRSRFSETDPYWIMYNQELGLAYHACDQLDEAAETYERVLEKAPFNLPMLNNLSYLLANDMGRGEDALKYAERLLKIAPENGNVLDTVGWVQFKVGNASEAERTLRKAETLAPSAVVYYHLGAVLAELSKSNPVFRREAESMLKKALELESKQSRKGVNQITDKAKALLAEL